MRPYCLLVSKINGGVNVPRVYTALKNSCSHFKLQFNPKGDKVHIALAPFRSVALLKAPLLLAVAPSHS